MNILHIKIWIYYTLSMNILHIKIWIYYTLRYEYIAH